MSEDRGLTEVALPDLEALLRRTGTDPPSDDARDTLVVVRELFESAQKSVLDIPMGGCAFDHGKDFFAPLHKAMAETRVETTIFWNSVEGFIEKNWPFGEPLPSIYCDPRTAKKGIPIQPSREIDRRR